MAELIAILEDLPPPTPIAPLTTDVMGQFSFRDLDAGSYTLDVAKSGYTLLQPDPKQEYSAADAPIKLAYGGDQRKVELRLTRLGSIHGRIRDFDGKPAAGVPVQALLRDSLRWQIIEETRTDSNGAYQLDAVVPGSCIVAAGAAIALTSLFETQNSPDGEYAHAFYADSSSPETAATLVVKGGDRLTADFTLNPARRHRIRGKVVIALDKSWPTSVTSTLASKAPTLIARRSSAGESTLIHYNPRDGSFEVDDLLPGLYTISMTARRPSNEADMPRFKPAPKEDFQELAGSVTVVISDSDVEQAGITLELKPFK
jgi:hypothetical protein